MAHKGGHKGAPQTEYNECWLGGLDLTSQARQSDSMHDKTDKHWGRVSLEMNRTG